MPARSGRFCRFPRIALTGAGGIARTIGSCGWRSLRIDCSSPFTILGLSFLSCSPCREYLKATEADQRFLEERNFATPDEKECRNSWQRMFNLELAHSCGFRWKSLTLQATSAIFYASEIREIDDNW
jgi:hypothetical protein